MGSTKAEIHKAPEWVAEGFRNRAVVKKLSEKLHETLRGLNCSFMEVCGTHTMSIHQFGLRDLFPPELKMISGPGCPVCVTPNEYIDKAIELSSRKEIIITTFGDLVRVPGSRSSLEHERAKGAEVRVLYSPAMAIAVAKENPEKTVVFLSVGFETTAPLIASAILKAKEEGVKNFCVLTSNKTVPEALKVLACGKVKLDGFLCPGHVSVVIGAKAYEELVHDFHIPCAIAGFEPADIMLGLLALAKQVKEKNAFVDNAYSRAVSYEGSLKAQEVLNEVFVECDAEWRGVGVIPRSGLKLSKAYRDFCAEERYEIKIPPPEEPKGCRCGEVLTGACIPLECPLFGKRCTPENPVGACMVSSEGTCAAYYKYGRF